MTQIYYGTKKIKAEPMNRAEYNTFRGWTLPADENGDDEGYLVEYQDGGKPNVEGRSGYVSWSPKEQFDNAYQPITTLSFGHAVQAAKYEGKKIAREGWNGKDQFVYYVPENSYKAQTDVARSTFGEFVPYRAYLALKTTSNDVATWVPSISDVLANDWQIIQEPTETMGEPVTVSATDSVESAPTADVAIATTEV